MPNGRYVREFRKVASSLGLSGDSIVGTLLPPIEVPYESKVLLAVLLALDVLLTRTVALVCLRVTTETIDLLAASEGVVGTSRSSRPITKACIRLLS